MMAELPTYLQDFWRAYPVRKPPTSTRVVYDYHNSIMSKSWKVISREEYDTRVRPMYVKFANNHSPNWPGCFRDAGGQSFAFNPFTGNAGQNRDATMGMHYDTANEDFGSGRLYSFRGIYIKGPTAESWNQLARGGIPGTPDELANYNFYRDDIQSIFKKAGWVTHGDIDERLFFGAYGDASLRSDKVHV